MKKSNNINSILIIELLVFIGWCVSVILFTNFRYTGFNFWCGFFSTVFAFLVVCISLITMNQSQNINTKEVTLIPYVISIVYLGVAIVFNGIFIFGMYIFLSRILVTFNIIWFILFVGIRLSAVNYIKHIENQTKKITGKTSNLGSISTNISMIASKVTDSEIKKELLKLKESVDYSSNISQNFTIGFENQMLEKLNEINTMVEQHVSNKEIINKIQNISNLWNVRNSMNSTIR